MSPRHRALKVLFDQQLDYSHYWGFFTAVSGGSLCGSWLLGSRATWTVFWFLFGLVSVSFGEHFKFRYWLKRHKMLAPISQRLANQLIFLSFVPRLLLFSCRGSSIFVYNALNGSTNRPTTAPTNPFWLATSETSVLYSCRFVPLTYTYPHLMCTPKKNSVN